MIFTISRSKMNGAFKSANKNINKIMQNILRNKRGWTDNLSLALLAYQTSIRTSTGATTYSLVCGIEAVLPIGVEKQFLRTLLEENINEDELIQVSHDQLALIEEKKMDVVYQRKLYKKRTEKAYNKKVKLRMFKENDLMLKTIFPIQ